MTLSNLMRRITALRFQRISGLSLVDGWIISHLGGGGPMSLDALAHRSGLAKSQMSRGVTDMVERKLVRRQRNPKRQTEVILTLTPEGRSAFKEIKRRWPEYNRLLMLGMNDEQTAAFAAVVDRLIENSRRNLIRERAGAVE
jgi:DNA-binding MarR family transcriptional regulator